MRWGVRPEILALGTGNAHCVTPLRACEHHHRCRQMPACSCLARRSPCDAVTEQGQGGRPSCPPLNFLTPPLANTPAHVFLPALLKTQGGQFDHLVPIAALFAATG